MRGRTHHEIYGDGGALCKAQGSQVVTTSEPKKVDCMRCRLRYRRILEASSEVMPAHRFRVPPGVLPRPGQ